MLKLDIKSENIGTCIYDMSWCLLVLLQCCEYLISIVSEAILAWSNHNWKFRAPFEMIRIGYQMIWPFRWNGTFKQGKEIIWTISGGLSNFDIQVVFLFIALVNFDMRK